MNETVKMTADAENARAQIAQVKTSEVVTLRRKLERIRNLCEEL